VCRYLPYTRRPADFTTLNLADLGITKTGCHCRG
jgi:hypothetical protein